MAPILRYFIVRPATEVILSSGEVEQRAEAIVPLIPMDLIPEGIDIKGVPRQLTLTETMGMTHVGTSTLKSDRNEAGTIYVGWTGVSTSTSATANTPYLGRGSPGQVAEHRAAGNSPRISQSIREASTPSNRPAPSMITPMTPAKTPTRPPHSSTDPKTEDIRDGHHPRRSGSRSRSPSDPPEEPLYCQPWCHHGKCPRGDGCRSKHEMPATLEGLKKVGLEKLPIWYCQNKPRRTWQPRAREAWTPRKQSSRSSVDSWPPRYQGRSQSHEDRAKAENSRALELMNRDNPAEKEVEKREGWSTGQVREHSARENQDLISMDYPDSLPRSVMYGNDA